MPSIFFMTNGITLISMLFTILTLIILFIKKRNNRIASKVYVALLLVTILSMTLNIIWGAFAPTNEKLTTIFGKLFTFSVTCWNYLLAFYVAVVFKTDDENEKYYSKHNMISYVLGGILVLINVLACVFLEFKPYLLDDTIYNIPGFGPYILGGSLAKFQSIVGAIALLFAIGTIIYHRKRVDLITKILCVFASLISGISIIFKLSGILVLNDTSFLHAIVILFLFLSIESQDRALLEEFNQSNLKAEESNKLRSEFIMNMSHQLRTPMNTILGFSDSLLTTDKLMQSDLIDDTRNIEIASKKLLDLINSILDISKLESNKEVINNVEYSLDTVIYDISSNINSLIDNDNLSFTINAKEDCPNALFGDDYKIAKILNIFLSGVVKGAEYGSVSLDVSSQFIETGIYEFSFHIKNTGKSMSSKDFNITFDDLIKLNSESDNEIDADTLKIIVAKGLLEIIGGNIEFINEVGQGSQYIIKIKQKVLSDEKIGDIREKIQTKHEVFYNRIDLSNKKCLIIDDEKINTIILRRLLRPFKIEIDFTPNPREGIGMAGSEDYDIIFVNHEMKDVSGEEVIRKIESSGNRIPPVVGLTSISDDLTENNSYAAHIMCPIEFRELNRVINKIFK